MFVSITNRGAISNPWFVFSSAHIHKGESTVNVSTRCPLSFSGFKSRTCVKTWCIRFTSERLYFSPVLNEGYKWLANAILCVGVVIVAKWSEKSRLFLFHSCEIQPNAILERLLRQFYSPSWAQHVFLIPFPFLQTISLELHSRLENTNGYFWVLAKLVIFCYLNLVFSAWLQFHSLALEIGS